MALDIVGSSSLCSILCVTIQQRWHEHADVRLLCLFFIKMRVVEILPYFSHSD